MDTNKKYIEKLNKLTEEMCRFYDILPFLGGEHIEKYDCTLRVINLVKMGIDRKAYFDDLTQFEREIKFLCDAGFARLAPFHSVISQIRFGKSYTEFYGQTIQKNLKDINKAIREIRSLQKLHEETKYTKLSDLWQSRPVHK